MKAAVTVAGVIESLVSDRTITFDAMEGVESIGIEIGPLRTRADAYISISLGALIRYVENVTQKVLVDPPQNPEVEVLRRALRKPTGAHYTYAEALDLYTQGVRVR